MANRVLSVDGRFHLRLATSGQNSIRTSGMPTEVPVWIVAERGLGPNSVAFSDDTCGMVYVQTPALIDRIAQWNGDGKTGLEIDDAAIAAWLLLHEVGHIEFHESSSFDAAPLVRGVNFADSADKPKEMAADRYAADVLKRASNNANIKAMVAASSMTMALSNLSYNLTRDRILGDFAATTLETPEGFGDPGYTHPNLELRLLTINAYLTESPQVLEDFIERRRRAGKKASASSH
jgi:hypothetical protein